MNYSFKLANATIFLLLFSFNVINQDLTKWQTPAEKSNYRTTPRYTETLDYLKKLDLASPYLKLTSFGKTGQDRELLLVIAAKNNSFTPAAVRRQNKAVILVQACIHAGESDGKDAGLALLRDIAIAKSEPKLLDNVVLLFLPIYNPDGHERMSPYNRINQNGPEEMGWRGNARNINLNRDYIKADELETRAWLRLWNDWLPDLFVDCHVTDGADYQYDLTYQFEHHETVAPPIRRWLQSAIEKRAVAETEKAGHLIAPYLQFRDNRDLTKGVDEFLSTPRFATGYPVLHNRPAILIETHMLKSYKTRVSANYDFLRAIIAEINQNPHELFDANKKAELEMSAKFSNYNENASFPLRLALTEESTQFSFKGVESKIEQSQISGTNRVIFDSAKPVNLIIPFFNQTKVADAVAPPLAYVVPPQWSEVIERLKLHGLKFERQARAQTLDVEMYRLTKPKWASTSFESRVMLRDFKIEKVKEKKEFPANSVLVKLQQPAAQVAIHLLEPLAPDSLVRWGFFNSIFEQKEYGEAYVLEKLAREMLAKDLNLRREFEERLQNDKDFAASPQTRLNFFFERSAYFDKNIGLYPIGRIIN